MPTHPQRNVVQFWVMDTDKKNPCVDEKGKGQDKNFPVLN
jgi:hypothetical protein